MTERSTLATAGLKYRTSGVSKRMQRIIVSPIKEMALLAQAHPNAISFAWGIPSFNTPEHIREAVIQELRNNPAVAPYTPIPGLPKLREAVAQRLENRHQISVDPTKDIMITAGAMEGVFAVLMTIIDPGDEVIVMSPGFASHVEQILLADGVPVYVPLIEKNGWRIDITHVEQAITSKTKAILLNHPGNPTGIIFTESELRHIGDLAIKHNLFIITDEPYDFIVFDKQPLFSLIKEPKYHDRLIACFSFSKEYAMTGWRVGYLFTKTDLINQMLKIHDVSVVCAPAISQLAAIHALNGPQDSVAEHATAYSKRCDLMCERLDRLPQLFQYERPGGAYYLFPRLVGTVRDAKTFAIGLLNKAEVAVVPGDGFGPTGKEHVRFCFAYAELQINEGFDRIERYAKNL